MGQLDDATAPIIQFGLAEMPREPAIGGSQTQMTGGGSTHLTLEETR